MPPKQLYDIRKTLKQMSEGDEQAFRVIFDLYKAPFHAAAYKMTRSAYISEEIVQEVFVTVWIKRALIAGAKRPEEYAFAILRNCIYAQFRKLAQECRIKSKLGQQPAESANYIEDNLDEKETRTILENVIDQLSPQQKLIYKLAKQEGLSREEIANKLNISPNTVKNHLGTAVEYLRRSFKSGASAITCIAIWMHV